MSKGRLLSYHTLKTLEVLNFAFSTEISTYLFRFPEHLVEIFPKRTEKITLGGSSYNGFCTDRGREVVVTDAVVDCELMVSGLLLNHFLLIRPYSLSPNILAGKMLSIDNCTRRYCTN